MGFRKGSLACAALCGLAFGAFAEEITVGSGETHTLTAAENVYTTVFKLADGATLALPSDISKISCNVDIVGADSVATLDATASADALWLQCVGASKPVRIRSVGDTGKLVQSGSGKLVVKGKDALTIGFAKRTEGTINFPECGADIAFVDADGNAYAEPAGVSFVNNVLIRRLPASAPYAFASDTIVAIGGNDPLGLTGAVTFEPAYDLFGPIAGGDSGIPTGPRIVIGEGHSFCGRGVTASDTGWGRAAGKVANAVEINGTLQSEQTDWLTFSGAVTGAGLICSKSTTADTDFTGAVDFDGTVNLEKFRTLRFSKAARVGTLRAVSGNQPLVIKDMLDVDRLEGPLVLTDASTGTLHVVVLAAGATVTVPESVKLRIDATEDEAARVTLAGESGTYSIAGPASPTATAVKYDLTYPAGDVALTLGGRIATGVLPANVTSVALAEDCDWTPPVVHDDWQSKVSFWLDANAPASMILASEYFTGYEEAKYYRSGTVGGSPLVYVWGDCRGESVSPYYLRNQRVGQSKSDFSSYGTSMLPALATATVNGSGKRYIDMSTSNSGASVVTNNSQRTAMFGTSMPSQFAIVVFGSQAGGGMALLANGSGAFNRSGYGNSAAKATQYNIATNAFETYVDGGRTNPVEATFSGGWQIVSMKTDGKTVSGMGFGSAYTADRGYVNVAEAMIFSAVPTERERMAAEKYLADKWDIAISHGGVEPLPQELTLSGTGTITLTADTTIHGTFGGNINVNGHALTIAADGNLREATPHGTGSITAATYRQMPKRTNCSDFTGTMDPPPPGLSIIFR